MGFGEHAEHLRSPGAGCQYRLAGDDVLLLLDRLFHHLFANLQTLGETLLLTPLRGSVADVSPSGQHVGSALLTLNQGVTEAIFQDRLDRFGAAVDAGKLYYWGHASSFHDVIDTSILFGDPALRLRLPPIVSVAGKGRWSN